jgi:hypothetical protein
VADQLRVLHLVGTGCTADGLRLLARSPRLAGLRHLDLSSNEVGDVSGLADSPLARGLISLNLMNTNLDERAGAVLAECSQLAVLNLRANGLGSKGAEVLACAAPLDSLLRLDLRANHIRAPVRQELVRRCGQRLVL